MSQHLAIFLTGGKSFSKFSAGLRSHAESRPSKISQNPVAGRIAKKRRRHLVECGALAAKSADCSDAAIVFLGRDDGRVQQKRDVCLRRDQFKQDGVENNLVAFWVAVRGFNKNIVHYTALADPTVIVAHMRGRSSAHSRTSEDGFRLTPAYPVSVSLLYPRVAVIAQHVPASPPPTMIRSADNLSSLSERLSAAGSCPIARFLLTPKRLPGQFPRSQVSCRTRVPRTAGCFIQRFHPFTRHRLTARQQRSCVLHPQVLPRERVPWLGHLRYIPSASQADQNFVSRHPAM